MKRKIKRRLKIARANQHCVLIVGQRTPFKGFAYRDHYIQSVSGLSAREALHRAERWRKEMGRPHIFKLRPQSGLERLANKVGIEQAIRALRELRATR